MRWMICWNEEGGMATDNLRSILDVADAVQSSAGKFHDSGYRARLLVWLNEAELGDVLEFPLGIVVCTSKRATEIGYDQEETGS